MGTDIEKPENARNSIERRAEVAGVLAEIGQLMTAALDLDAVYDRFAELAGKLLPFDRIAVATVDLESETMTTTYESGIPVPAWGPGITRPLFRPVAGIMQESRGALLLDREIMEWVAGEYPEMQDILDAGLHSTLAIPMFDGDRPMGFLALNSRLPTAYDAEDGELAEQVVAQIAGVIANARLRAELQQEIEQRTALAEIGRLVGSSFELDEMYETLAGLIRGLIPFDRIAILRADADAGTVTTEYVDGVAVVGRSAGDTVPITGTILELAIRDRGTVRVEAGAGADNDRYAIFSTAADAGIHSVVLTPLVSQGRIIGAIALGAKRAGEFSSAAVDLLERIAAQVGGAIGAAQLRAQLQAEADARVEQLQNMDSLRLQFLRMVTHEFRTPLASLRVSRDLLAETPLSDLDADSFARLVSNMGRGVDRLDTLVTDLLDLTIAQAGELNLNIEAVDLHDLIGDAVEIVSPLASRRNQSFRIDIEPLAPLVRVDRQRIEQVLLNLLSNAHKYSDEEAVIEVAVTRGDDAVEIRVTGKGPEIPEGDRPYMFEPFFRGTGEGIRTVPGRGLGLSIARAFVELHGGKIGFDSIPGKGSSFYFTLPLGDEAAGRKR